MPTIIDNFNKGDLVYGLSANRKKVESLLKDKVGSKVPVIVDEYNAHVIPLFIDHNFVSHEQFTVVENSFLSSLAHNQKLHSDYLSSHYTILKNIHKATLRITNHEFKENEKGLCEDQRRTRRACKARLLDNSVQIHFILDDIDIRHTFDRKFSLESKEALSIKNIKCPHDAFTNAELRFTFKHYEEVKNHIKFYARDKEIDIFDWLSQKNAVSRNALFVWAKTKFASGKITKTVLDKIERISFLSEQASLAFSIDPNASAFCAASSSPASASPAIISPTPLLKTRRLPSFPSSLSLQDSESVIHKFQ